MVSLERDPRAAQLQPPPAHRPSQAIPLPLQTDTDTLPQALPAGCDIRGALPPCASPHTPPPCPQHRLPPTPGSLGAGSFHFLPTTVPAVAKSHLQPVGWAPGTTVTTSTPHSSKFRLWVQHLRVPTATLPLHPAPTSHHTLTLRRTALDGSHPPPRVLKQQLCNTTSLSFLTLAGSAHLPHTHLVRQARAGPGAGLGLPPLTDPPPGRQHRPQALQVASRRVPRLPPTHLSGGSRNQPLGTRPGCRHPPRP